MELIKREMHFACFSKAKLALYLTGAPTMAKPRPLVCANGLGGALPSHALLKVDSRARSTSGGFTAHDHLQGDHMTDDIDHICSTP